MSTAERSPSRSRSASPRLYAGIRDCLAAILAVAAAALIGVALGPLLRTSAPLLVFVLAILAAALYGGFRAGIAATGLALITISFFFLERRIELTRSSGPDWTSLALLTMVGIAASSLMRSLHRANRAAMEGQRQIEIDVEEIRKSQEALQLERNRLDAIMRATDVMLVYLDRDFNFVAVNQAYADSCRMRPEELIGKNHFELYPDAENEAIFRRVREEGEPVFYKDKPFEYPDQPERGVTYWDWSLTPVKDPAGKVAALVFSLRETTAYKRAADALRKPAEELERRVAERTAEVRAASLYARSLIEASLDPLVTISPEGKITDVNRSTERVTGVGRERLIGTSFFEYFTEPRNAEEGFHQVLSAGLVRDYPLTIRHVSGTTTDVLYNATVYRGEDGKVRGVFAAARDVTERKRMEERLRSTNESLQQMAAIVESSEDAITGKTLDGEIVSWNHGAERIYGYAASEIIGKPMAILVPPDRPDEVPRILERIRRGERVEHFETARVRKDGTRLTVSLTVSPIKDGAGRIVGASTISRDVTERKQMEEEVHAASLYARSLIEASLDPLLTISPEGRITDVNEATELITGVPRKRLIGSSFSSYFTEPYKAEAGYQKVLGEGSVRDYPLTIRHVSGRMLDVLYNASVYRDQAGAVQGVFAAARDITLRKRMEEELRVASLYARSLIEASLDPLVTISPEGKITDVNEATELVTGAQRDRLIGSDFSEYFTEPDRARAGYRQVLSDALVRDYPLTIRHARGQTTDVLYNAAVYRNEAGQVQGVFAAARDVTERKRLEEELRVASLYARSLIEASLDPLVTISPEGQITDVNEATESVTGVPRARLIGSDFSDYFTEPDRARAGYRKVLSDGLVRDYPLTIRHADGHTTDVLYNAAVYRNEAGQVQGVFAAARDVTERKRAEAELARYRGHLEELVQQRTSELETANTHLKRTTTELVRSNQELEQFAYVASHDLQEPLRAVTGYLGMLEQRIGRELDDDSRHQIDGAVQGAARMHSLIIDLLALSRVGTRGQTFEPTDLNAVLDQTLEALRASVEETGARVTRDPLPKVRVDSNQMVQLFQNLIGNAIKFRGKRVPEIHVAAMERADQWVFTVRDNGIGIERQYFERIFMIFQRLHTRRLYPGTGIGLAVCKKIVERHGGTIWVESQPGQGSAFSFTIQKRETL